MNWFYVENGKQAGPVEEADFPTLIGSGKLRAETLVWREGMPSWEPFQKAFPEAFAARVPPVAGMGAAGNEAMCVECGGVFARSEMITHAGAYVCARCKPVFMQRLSEGGAAAIYRAPGSVSVEELTLRDYEVDIGSYLRRSWEMYKANAGGIIAASFLVYLCIMAVNLIPYLNFLLNLFLTGPLIGGLWLFYVKGVRQQNPALGDAFSGFGPRYWQLVLVQMIPSLIVMGLMVFVGIIMAITVPAFVAVQRSGGSNITALSPLLLVVFGVVFLTVMVAVIYFSVCWLFALPLVSDKGMTFWPALQLSRRMVTKHWWWSLCLMLVASILGMLGFFACGVGILVSGPVAFGMFACHYEKVFGELTPQG